MGFLWKRPTFVPWKPTACLAMATLIGAETPPTTALNATVWKPSPSTTSTMTGTSFRLTGKHRVVECFGCHVSSGWNKKEVLTFLGVPEDCQGCHWSPHPGKYRDCASCHTTSDWRVSEW